LSSSGIGGDSMSVGVIYHVEVVEKVVDVQEEVFVEKLVVGRRRVASSRT
jgi:hypothetical protein